MRVGIQKCVESRRRIEYVKRDKLWRGVRCRRNHRAALVIDTALRIARDIVESFLADRRAVIENLRGFQFRDGGQRHIRHRRHKYAVHVSLHTTIGRGILRRGFLRPQIRHARNKCENCDNCQQGIQKGRSISRHRASFLGATKTLCPPETGVKPWGNQASLAVGTETPLVPSRCSVILSRDVMAI
jgi:hypothetical protein